MSEQTRKVLGAPPGRAYRGWVLGVLTAISMFGFIDRQILSALGQPIKGELHLSDTQLGLLGGLAFGVLNSLIGLPIGRLADRFSRVTIYAVGVFLWSIATAACGLAAGFVQLLFARACVGIGEATQQPTVGSLVADYYPSDRRTSAMAIYVLSVPAGALVGSFGGGWIAQHANWRLAFVAAGAPGLVMALLLFLTVREPVRGRFDAPGLADKAPPPFSAVLRRMVDKPAFLHTLLGSTLASAAGFGINVFLAPFFFRRFGLDFAQSGLLAGLISAIPGSISMAGAGFLADRLGRRDARAYAWIPGLGSLLAAPLYVLSFMQGGWGAATALLMATGLMQYAYMAPSFGVFQNLMEPRMRSSSQAVVGIFINLVASGAGPLLVGALSDAFARRAFAGDFHLACAGARAAQTAAAGPCGQASAAGLHWAFTITALLYLWSALHFALAGRTIRQDMA